MSMEDLDIVDAIVVQVIYRNNTLNNSLVYCISDIFYYLHYFTVLLLFIIPVYTVLLCFIINIIIVIIIYYSGRE